MSSGDSESVWEQGWMGHEDRQLRRLAQLPFAEKLRWLEEAQRLARHLMDARSAEVRRTKAKGNS